MRAIFLQISLIVMSATIFGRVAEAAEIADRIVLVSNHSGDAQIYLAQAGELKTLTLGPGENTQPAWSPDGKKIVFTSLRDGNMNIYVMDADGANQRRLTDHLQPDNVPSWSPDGKKILFRSYRDRYANLYVMDADGSNLKRLTDSEFDKGTPRWSPDGRHIAYPLFVNGGKSQIHIMMADGTEDRDVTSLISKDPKVQPAWSPDGKKLAFVSVKSLHEIHIYVMDAEGTNPVNLTENPFLNSMPTWSPDGKRIAFVSNRKEVKVGRSAGDVYIMNADGSQAINLTEHEGNDDEPSFSNDGKKLYFLSLRNGLSQIFSLNLDNNFSEPLTNHGGHDLMYRIYYEKH